MSGVYLVLNLILSHDLYERKTSDVSDAIHYGLSISSASVRSFVSVLNRMSSHIKVVLLMCRDESMATPTPTNVPAHFLGKSLTGLLGSGHHKPPLGEEKSIRFREVLT